MSSAFMQNKKLGRGINIATALEAPKEGEWGIYIEDYYFEKIKSVGFSSVRIPVRWSAHSLNIFPYTIDEAFFNRIDTIIKTALGSGLAIVINMHHFEELYNSPTQNGERFLSLWKQISVRYKDFSDNLFFELLNEPHYRLTAKRWNNLLNKAIVGIRKTNPVRAILIGPPKWNKFHGLKSLELPVDDKNIILTLHYYSPFTFTHQGAEWVKFSNLFLGRSWSGTKKQLNMIEKNFMSINEWSLKFKIPINLGEFGAYNKADLNSRALWTSCVSRSAEKYNFSWFYWEFGAGFGLYNIKTGKWNQKLLNQLIPDG